MRKGFRMCRKRACGSQVALGKGAFIHGLNLEHLENYDRVRLLENELYARESTRRSSKAALEQALYRTLYALNQGISRAYTATFVYTASL